jgi:hypothetical protein
LERGFYADVAHRENGVPQLDLNYLDEMPAEAAVRWCLEEALAEKLKVGAVQQLEVITSPGPGEEKPRHCTDADVRATVEELCHQLEVKLLPTSNPGHLLLDLTPWTPEQPA